MGSVCGRRNSRIWAPPSTPPRLLWPRGMLSVTSTPSSTRCWRGHGGQEANTARAEAAIGRSSTAQGDHGDLVRVLLRHAVARDRPTIPFGTLYTLFARWTRVAPPAQPLDPGLATGLRRHSRTQHRHRRQPVVSFGTDLLRPRLRWRQENQGIHLAVGKYGFPLAINVSTANVHDSKGIVPVLHQLAGRGFKGTALGDLSYRGKRLSKAGEALGIAIQPSAGGHGGTFIPEG